MFRALIAAALCWPLVAAGADYYAGLAAIERNDYATAVREWQPLAEQGNNDAQVMLGLMYAEGKGVTQDYQEAAHWYRLAAEQGNAYGQRLLGRMYDAGKGVPWNHREAVRWYRLAAEQGDAEAELYLGLKYESGEGVLQDYQESARWYRLAAEQGNVYAQFNLARSYSLGWGGRADYVRAYAWFNLVVAEGNADLDKDARKFRGWMADKISQAQLAEAQQLSRALQTRTNSDGTRSPRSVAVAPARASGPSREMVRESQELLAGLGYDPGPIDGLLGKRTIAAVKQAQRDLKVEPTGRISGELVRLLQIAVAALNAAPEAPTQPGVASTGSGFVVSRTGAVITNHHVVEDCKRVSVGHGGADYAATVRVADAGSDLALLIAEPSVGEPASFSTARRAELGQTVTVAGFPLSGLLSSGLNVTRGEVSALGGPGDDPRLLQITAPVQSGNSGGPLLDQAGNVVGVVVAKLNVIRTAKLTGDFPQNINFAIKGAVTRSFLDIHGVDYQQRSSDKPVSPEGVAAMARGFTVAVQCWK